MKYWNYFKCTTVSSIQTRVFIPKGSFRSAMCSEFGLTTNAYESHSNAELALELIQYWSLVGSWIMSLAEIMNRFRIQFILPSVFQDNKLNFKDGNEKLMHLSKVQEFHMLYRQCVGKFGKPGDLGELMYDPKSDQ